MHCLELRHRMVTRLGCLGLCIAMCALLGAPPAARAQKKKKSILAVADIEDRSGRFEASDVRTAADILRGLIISSGIFLVVDKSRQEEKKKAVIRDLKRDSHAACYDDQCRIELGKALSADSLLACSLGALGKHCNLNCELVPLEREVAESGGVATFVCGTDGLLEAVHRVASQITGVSTRRPLAAPEPVTTRPADTGPAPGASSALFGNRPEDNNPGGAEPQPPPAVDSGQWLYELDGQTRATLEMSGCTFGKQDRLVANRLAKRGFTVAQFLSAYEQTRRLGGDPVDVEATAVFREIGVPISKFNDYKSYGGTPTEFVNARLIGGRGSKIAGWIVSGVGIGWLALGGLYIFIGDQQSSVEDDFGSSSSAGDVLETVGYVCVGIGGVLELIGIPLIISGTSKTKRWLPAGTLERVPARELRKFPYQEAGSSGWDYSDSGDADSDGPGLRFMVSPVPMPEGGGAGVIVVF